MNDNIPVEHQFALSYDGREVTSQMLEAIKQYHSEEVAEFGEDVENDFEKWYKQQTQMDVDYILDKMM